MSRRARSLLLLVAGTLVVAACGDERQDVFTPEGEIADKINKLQIPVFIAAGVIGVVVAAMIVFVVVRFRQRPGEDGVPEPVQVHGNFKLEIGWTIIPAAILFVVAIGTVATLFDVTDEPDDAMHVTVYGQQWWWSYEYELDGNPDNGPEIVTANDLVIPAGEPVVLELKSRDVIHSFWIPALNGTRDVVPGRTHTLVVEADEPGVYDGQCKEYCGLSHANMKARAVALSATEFETWLDQQQEEAESPTDDEALLGEAYFKSAACGQCHTVRGVHEAADPETWLVSGHAPDLTHFMSRGVFASGKLPLYLDNGELNRSDLEEWLRNPHELIPMDADGVAPERGMPDLDLTEDQIDQLVAWLETLGPAPPLTQEGG